MTRKITLLYFICALMSFSVKSQEYTLTKSDSIIFKAMTDEMNRSMNKLQEEDKPKPFFMCYTLSDVNLFETSASFGALEHSSENHGRDWTLRLIVGNYNINDENYIRSNRMSENENFNLPLPIDDDYAGIRRTFWLASNNSYKRAAANYLDKIKTIKENELADSIFIEDFSKEPTVKLLMEPDEIEIDKSKYNQLVKEWSELFSKHTDIVNSNVSLSIVNSINYLVNTEGSKIRVPNNSFQLTINASIIDEEARYEAASIEYYAIRNQDIPDSDSVKNDIELLISHLYNLKSVKELEENYSGPVLVSGHKVANTIGAELFSGSNSLIAQRTPLYSSFNRSMHYGNRSNSYEKKIGKKIAKTDISVKLLPYATEFNNTGLIGTFHVDSEGVKPPEELVLLEDSKLQTLLNDRTPTEAIKHSNGHKRFIMVNGYTSKRICPSNIFVTSKTQLPEKELKAKLIEMVKDEGLDYAVIYRPIKKGANYYPNQFFKIDVNTGEETMIRRAYFSYENTPDLFRNIESFSADTVIYNIMNRGGYGASLTGPASYVGPGSILFKNYEVHEQRQILTKNKKPIVSPPKFE